MKAVNMLHALKKKITRNQDIFEQLLNAAELFHMDYFFRRVMENGFKKKYYLIKKGEFHSSMRKNYIGQLDEITSSSERLEARTEKLLSLYMPTEEVKEYTDSIFMPVKDSLACFKSMLQAN
jgi:hypothetical protein